MRSCISWVFSAALCAALVVGCGDDNGGGVAGSGGDAGMGGSAGAGGSAGSGGSAGMGGVGGTGGMAPVCGNGVMEAGETCDDGNMDNTDSCPDDTMNGGTCQTATCGDGFTWSTDGGSETCDDGNGVNTDACPDDMASGGTCQTATCGDGFVQSGVEGCDDGPGQIPPVSGDGCSDMCQSEACGNGVMDAGETCDDGNQSNDDSCPDDNTAGGNCQTATCGDGFIWNTDGGNETCDDGNSTNTDACPDDMASGGTCQTATCGDGFVQDSVDECDDGNTLPGDGCQDDCTLPRALFRVTNVSIADPNIGLNGIANGLINTAIGADEDMDGSLDLNLMVSLRPLDSTVPGSMEGQVLAGDCVAPAPTTSCSLAEGATGRVFAVTNSDSADCLTPDAGLVSNAFEAVNPVQSDCFGSDIGDLVVGLGTVNIPLSGADFAAQYDSIGSPGTITGVMRGFLSGDVAATTLIPPDVPIVGGIALIALFNAVPTDVGPDGTTLGWWGHFNFTATAVVADGAPTCGNGVVDAGETCDIGIPGSCGGLAACDDLDPCTTDRLVNGNPCIESCANDPPTPDDGSDNCCPAGPAGVEFDPDCAELECGDGVLGPDELCDSSAGTACDSLAACDDSNPCTADLLDDGPGPSVANECLCPSGTCSCDNAPIFEDPACIATCGDGVVTAPEVCDPASGTPCDSLAACDDGDPCTIDVLRKPPPMGQFTTQNECRCALGTCTECVNQAIAFVDDGSDMCCPNEALFSSTSDPNCMP